MNEKIFDKDKIQHFIVCLIASVFLPLFAAGLAIGKEYGDKHATGNHWCWLDLLADFMGIAIGTIPHILILQLLF